MGERLIPKNRFNAKGFFHDFDFDLAAAESPESVRKFIAARSGLGRTWGLNTRRTWEWVEFFPAPRIILATRRLESSRASWLRMGGGGEIERMAKQNREAACRFGRPVLEVDYDSMVEGPERHIERIADFVGMAATEEAFRFVDPELRHHVG